MSIAGSENRLIFSQKSALPNQLKFPTSKNCKLWYYTSSPTKYSTTRKAYCYFFKVLSIGTAVPHDQPKLESIALKIARLMKGSFIAPNGVAGFLRNTLNPQHWCMVLTFFRIHVERTLSLSAQHRPYDLMHPYIWRHVLLMA